MTRLVLGNRHATDSLDNGETRIVLPRGKRATEVEIPDEWPLSQAFTGITTPGGVWDTHSSAGAVPAWVASADTSLATLIASHYGGIEIRELEEN